mgnify:CR=1 FL=1
MCQITMAPLVLILAPYLGGGSNRFHYAEDLFGPIKDENISGFYVTYKFVQQDFTQKYQENISCLD